jgi:hypothetical protein
MPRIRRALLVTPLAMLALGVAGCGLTVTNERPSYEELDDFEQTAVNTVLAELSAFNKQVKARTAGEFNIDEIIDRERIHVSFEGLIFSANFGDDVVHVAVWENLGGKQALVQQWFKCSSPTQAHQVYGKLFYEFLAVVQGVKQFMYKVLTPSWVFGHRTLFNIERDSIRTALAHYVAEGRQQEMWGFLSGACSPVLSQYAEQFSSKFDKKYLQEHLGEIFNPDDPSGYMYFVCRWIELGKQDEDPGGLTAELDWLIDLPNP